MPDLTPSRLDRELIRLDGEDLIVLTDDAVAMAYPFSGLPTPFVVRLANGNVARLPFAGGRQSYLVLRKP